MTSLTAWQQALRARREQRRRQERLRRELGELRSPRERRELEDACARYDLTVEDLLAGRQPTAAPPFPERPEWEQSWDEIVLHLDLDDPDPGR